MHGKIIELTPSKFQKVLEDYPIAYIPVSPIEWHGEHLPFGTDAIRAEWLIKSVWKAVGGVLFPTEYCGTDGFVMKDNDRHWYLESVVNEKLPGNFLVDEDHFMERINWLISNVKRNGFKILVICTGHLSPQQINVLEKVEDELSSNDFRIIVWHSEKVKFPRNLQTEDYLHAGIEETSEMQYIFNKIVDVEKIGNTKNENKLGLFNYLKKSIDINFGKSRLHLEKKELTKVIRLALNNLGNA